MTTNDDLFSRLEQLNEIGAALSKVRDIDRLLEHILIAAKTITHADGGTLYRVIEGGKALRFEIIRTDSLNIAMGGTTGNPINFPNIRLYDDAGKRNDAMVAAYAAIRIINGTIPQFGQFMEAQGFPAGEAVVWAITVTELVAGTLMIAGRGVRAAAAALLAIAIGGIVLIHRHFGWFVGEHGTGGIEYSAALIILLLLIMADDKDRQRR